MTEDHENFKNKNHTCIRSSCGCNDNQLCALCFVGYDKNCKLCMAEFDFFYIKPCRDVADKIEKDILNLIEKGSKND